MEIEVIYPPAPDEVIPDRENDRLFQDLIERGDSGEFDNNNTECATEEEWNDLYLFVEDRWYRDPEYRKNYKPHS